MENRNWEWSYAFTNQGYEPAFLLQQGLDPWGLMLKPGERVCAFKVKTFEPMEFPSNSEAAP